MSFHADLTAAVWPADLVVAGIVIAAGRVYTGRKKQKVTHTDREVWLEDLEDESDGAGFQGLSRYAYMVHVIIGDKVGGSAGTFDAQKTALKAYLETIRKRYHGTLPFAGSVGTIVAQEAQIGSVDVDPESSQLEGTVRVVFYVED